ncbi:MAG: YciK family oxidoreductase [Gammaproteobacteria bacterium]
MKLADYTAKKNLLKDKSILVTGAAGGIGRAAARAFAEHGATVIILDKNIPALKLLYDQIKQDDLPEAAIYPMDLAGASVKDYETLEETLAKNFGKLDGLLHNAAILGSLSSISSYDLQQWQQVMTVNFNAPLLLTRACLSQLKASNSASVIFTSDTVGRKAKAYWGAYGISKFATEGLMQTLAEELDTNTSIRVNSIDPGPIKTLLRSAAYPGENPDQNPLPETIMDKYLYLMGDESQSINGQKLSAQ